ncbi:MAG: Cocaine esterase [bacterium]|nr:Cocaine esterase [bacterium]
MIIPNRAVQILLGVTLLASFAHAQADKIVPGATYIRDATMTTRDGVILVMDIILPKGDGPFPVMLWRNPYNKDGVTNGEARQFVEAGYAAVSQDTRGRFKSQGVWDAFRYERNDGYDTHEWISKQPWCNGSIGTAGGSYLGFTQCISGPEAHPALKAMVPEVPWGNTYRDCLYWGGAFRLLLATFWGSTQQLADVGKPMPDFSDGKLFRYLPLRTWDDCIGEPVPYLRDWVAHPTHDAYWRDHEVGDRIENLRCAALYIGGWFDIFNRGVLEYWSAARTRAKDPEAREKQFLIMGPWAHGGTVEDGKVGDLNFGPQSNLKKTRTRMAFLDEYVRGMDTGFSQRAPLQIFVMGANRWRDEHEWPLARTQYKNLYLQGEGPANTAEGRGKLDWSAPIEEGRTDTYVYDPENPVPTHGGPLLWVTAGPRDQSAAERRPDVLVYTSDVLTETLEVTGPVRLVLHAASSARDTDWTAKLLDVFPTEDGKGVPYGIAEGILRARFRESDTKTSLIEPGKVYEYTMDLGPTSNAFVPGHRIRLEVSSSNFPRFDRNPNTGHDFGADAETVKAEQTVYRDRARPSHLVLPVIGN